MTLSDDQRKQLEAMWDVYGNEGEKYTIGNHKLIQRLLFDADATFDAALAQYADVFGGGSGGGPAKDLTEECLSELKTVLGV